MANRMAGNVNHHGRLAADSDRIPLPQRPIQPGQAVAVGANQSVNVGASRTVSVGADHAVQTGGSHSEQIGGTPGEANFVQPDDLLPVTTTLVGQGADWQFDDSGTDRGSSWREASFVKQVT